MLKKSLYVICTASLLSASTTMCYKKDHFDPSTIETIALDGGECSGKLSVNDMKKDGYHVDSMKMQDSTNGFNYIYIFKNEVQKQQIVSSLVTPVGGISDEQLTQQLNKIRNKEKIEIEKIKIKKAKKNGKKLYISKCSNCHGKRGEKESYNLSRPLNSLSLDEMKISITDYVLGEKDNGMAIIMTPYANLVTEADLENIYNYIQTLK